MINRLRHLRKNILKINQDEFARKIDISRANLSSIEIERVSLTERNIKKICQVFNINENWLRDGIEPIFNDKDYVFIDELTKKYNLSPDEKELIKRFSDLDKNKQNIILNYIFETLKEHIEDINDEKFVELKNILKEKKIKN